MRRLLVVALALAAAPLAAQTPAAGGAPDGVMFQFMRFADIFGGRLVAAFDSIPASRYDYRPTPTQQTIGYIAQHLEDANYGLCQRFSELKPRRSAKDSLPDTVKARWPKDTLVRRLDVSLQFCDQAMQRAGKVATPALASALLAFETDLAEHYAQLSSYMRMIGLVPPSALPAPRRTAIELPPSALPAFAGMYELSPGMEIEVTLRDGALWARSTMGGAPVRLRPESDRKFFIEEADLQLTFTRDAAGTVTGLMLRQWGRDRPARKVQR